MTGYNMELYKKWKSEDLGYGVHPCGLRFFDEKKKHLVARDYDRCNRYQKVIALDSELRFFIEHPKRMELKGLNLEEFITFIHFNR